MTEEQRKIDKIRFKTLYHLFKMMNESDQEILDFALEAVVEVTGSDIGYIYFTNEDESELTLHAWSKKVMPQCAVESYPEAYKVSETGLWGEAIRQRKPVITNDYQKSPLRRGYPEGHVPVLRHMNLPVFDHDKIVLLAGVGNKKEEYTQEDVQQLSLIMDGMWNILKRKWAEQELKKSNENLERLVEKRTSELEATNNDLHLTIEKQNRAERSLAGSEALFRGVFNNAAAGIVRFLPTGQVTLANQVSADLLGYTHGEMMSKTIRDIIHPDDMKDALTNLSVNMEKGKKQWSNERKLMKKDGSPLWANINATILKDSSGQIESILLVATDITSRVNAEAQLKKHTLALKKNKEQLQAIMDNVPALISYVDQDLYYQFANARYREMFHISPDTIVGKHVSELIGKETFEQVQGRYREALKGKIQRFEFSYKLSSKTYILDVTYLPHRFGETIEGLFILLTDITERKRIELELKTYSDRLALASHAGGIGVWEWDITTNDLIWDERMMELYNVRPGEFTGAYDAWQNRVHPEDIEKAENALKKGMTPGGRFDWEFRIVWPDNQIRIIKAAALSKRAGNGKGLKMTGVNWDITQQKQMENNLKDLSVTDPLTGAKNRRFFMEKAREEIERSCRYQSPLSLLTLDIDHFKSINDTHGHDAGDHVLKTFVRECLKKLRSTDIFCRIGGEEFAAVLVHTDMDDARIMGERLRKSIENLKVQHMGKTIRFTVSCGLSQFKNQKDSLKFLMKRSDTALYQAKLKGRNRVESA